jgi:DNA-binding XRE family transcriptional regulator
MTRVMRLLRSAAAIVALALGAWMVTAMAADKVVLRDGTVVEGTIVREVDGFVWIRTRLADGIEQEKMFTPEEVASIERSAGATPAPAVPVAARDDKPVKSFPGGPRAAVITLGSRDPGHGDTIGIDIQAYELREMLPMLEEELGTDGTGVVVFRITSGGGLLLEIQRLSDVIHNEYKKRFRTVGWIDSAISAAAMTAHCIEEIYFTPQGNYGACTGWYGALQAVKGRGLEEVLYMMERISARGGYNPLIMRAMQIQQPLSATIDANGEVHWYADAKSGEIVVNRENEILTFNAETAARVKFSRGTANSIEDLQRLMGYRELHWVGKYVKGYTWPISKAEEWNLNWRRKVHEDQENMNRYFATYQQQVAAAASEPLETRAKFVNMARQTLNKIKEAARRNPNMALLTFNVFTEEELKEIFEREEKRLRDLMRK